MHFLALSKTILLIYLDINFSTKYSTYIDKPKVVSRSQSQKLTTWFSLKSQCPTTPTPPPPGKVSKKQDRAILPK